MSIDHLIASALCGFAKLLTGVRAVWLGSEPDARPRVYFANHRSHGDFVLIWASLPPHLRYRTRPVAGADYWLTTGLRRFLINRVFRGVTIDRRPDRHGANPVEQMGAALAAGESLILFPEGTRNLGEGVQAFKSGIHHLLKAHPEAEFIPVWIENLGRVMPKGSLIPVPLLCSLTFGPALVLIDGESRDAFLTRARSALLDLAPPED
jgi:1-acyl-sn-glycerol-3-phosphate acyltransferase